MQKTVLSCDWGTTSFRLKLVDLNKQIVLSETTSEEGIASVNNAWTSQSSDRPDRLTYFQHKLKKYIKILKDKVSISLTNTPVLISGMASSSIGLKELPYAELPFHIDGTGAKMEKIYKSKDFLHDIYIISGVRNEHDVMRGEETQMVGIMENLPDEVEEALAIFPGTHSKHIKFQNKYITDFKTYMTGEVFSLMSTQSILKDTIEKNEQTLFDKEEQETFRSGVRYATHSELLNSLFSVRVNQLFKKINKHQNYFYLSGLLIGAELRNLKINENTKIILCSGSNIFELYKLALEELDLLKVTTLVSPESMDRSAVAGQIKMFKNYLKNEE